MIVRDLPHTRALVKRGHITRDIVFSEDGQQMFVLVGSASNNGEGMEKRNPAQLSVGKRTMGWAAHGVMKRTARRCLCSIPMAEIGGCSQAGCETASG